MQPSPTERAQLSSPTYLAELKRLPRRDHEASFFFFDPAFQVNAAKILPGEFFVFNEDIELTTTLGSCVAACICDKGAGIGGMNHFLLPDDQDGTASGRFGAFAMELLINELLKRGARRNALEAKIFGGGQVMKSFVTMNVGERNVEFVTKFLAAERIPILAKDVLDVYPRKVCMFPKSGRVLCKRLPATHGKLFEMEEARYQRQVRTEASGGDIELF
ncbi:MAG: chemoreceptor glutamine deamidase CheD [Burkholderiales bacterium]|nr:chemoreceptor glutamine deamidase CheD [Burkholderiales bacterium]